MGLGLGFQLSGGRAVYAWPPALELAPGARLAWPLWVHPRAAGTLDVSLAFCYEPAHAAPEAMKYRCAGCQHMRHMGHSEHMESAGGFVLRRDCCWAACLSCMLLTRPQ